MATRKTTTRGNTKTSKKLATKKVTSRRTTAAAATRGRATTKRTVAKTTITKKTTVNALGKQLRILAILTAALSVVTAILAGVFMNHTSYQLVMTFLSKDELLSKTSAVFVPAVRGVFDVELRWVVVVIMALSAVTPLLVLTRLKNYYANNLKNRSNLLRWLESAVVTALIVETIALISGVNDVMTLKLVAGLILIAAAFGYVAERGNLGAGKPNWTTTYLGVFAGVLPLLLIAVAAIGTILYGDVRAPWYLYTLYATTIAGLGMLLFTHTRLLRGLLGYEEAERNYLQINLFMRLAFGLVLVLGLLK